MANLWLRKHPSKEPIQLSAKKLLYAKTFRSNEDYHFATYTEITLQAADLKGDGRSQLLFQNVYGTIIRTFVLGGGGVLIGELPPDSPYVLANQEYNLDFNGNGKADFLVLGTTGYSIWEYDEDQMEFIEIIPFLSNSVLLNSNIYPEDINGDGKTDILRHNTVDNHLLVYISNGVGFEEETWPFDLNSLPNPPGCCTSDIVKDIFVRDFNNDGRCDIMFLHRPLSPSPGNETGYLNIIYSNNLSKNNFNALVLSFDYHIANSLTLIAPNPSALFPEFFTFGDYNGDGNLDVFWESGPGTTKKAIYLHNNEKVRLV